MSNDLRSADLLVKMLTTSPSYLADLQSKPRETLASVAKLAVEATPPALVGDRWVYRLVVLSLGIVAIAAMLGAIYLSTLEERAVPDVLTALGAAAIGALAGLQTPSPGK